MPLDNQSRLDDKTCDQLVGVFRTASELLSKKLEESPKEQDNTIINAIVRGLYLTLIKKILNNLQEESRMGTEVNLLPSAIVNQLPSGTILFPEISSHEKSLRTVFVHCMLGVSGILKENGYTPLVDDQTFESLLEKYGKPIDTSWPETPKEPKAP